MNTHVHPLTRRLIAAAILVAALQPARPVQAQYKDYGTPGLGGGVRIGGLMGQTESQLSDRADIDVRAYLSHGITEKLSGEIGAGYGVLAGSEDQYRTVLGQVDARLLYTPFQLERWSPFLYAGVGALQYDVDKAPSIRTPGADRRGWSAIVPAGVGVRYRLYRSVSAEVSGGYTHTFRDDLNATVLGRRDDVYWGAKLGFDLGRNPDPDGDGLLGKVERRHGTSPVLADTDGDGLDDGDEIKRYGTDPLRADTDGDGLTDGEEMAVYDTDPLRPDTDGDGLADGQEVQRYRTDPRRADTDADGLTDADEVAMYRTDPLRRDTDNDGLADGEEVARYGTDPLQMDTDADGVADGHEVSMGTDPLVAVATSRPRAPAASLPADLPKVSFGHGSPQLTPEGQQALDAVAGHLRGNRSLRLEIRGHSNDRREVGMRLSQSRADAVRSYLLETGVSPDRLVARAMGASEPLARGTTPEARQQNRRVELIVVESTALSGK